MDLEFLDWMVSNPGILIVTIFLLRVVNMALDTLRVLYTVRGRRLAVWVLGFSQSILWIVAITFALSSLDNIWSIIAYAAGFATGNIVGMQIEERLAIGHAHMRIISSHLGSAIVGALRGAGFAVTELSGRGKDGTVSVISCGVKRRDIRQARRSINEIDPDAFITIEDMRPLHRGFWRA
jgi:uncharacterized protein YebE (UPF0316 family)